MSDIASHSLKLYVRKLADPTANFAYQTELGGWE